MRMRAAIITAVLGLATVAAAQVHGVPASVTSVTSGDFRNAPGVPASVTSLGRDGLDDFRMHGFGVSGTVVFGRNPRVRLRLGDSRTVFFPVAVPVYVPVIVVPVAAEPVLVDENGQPLAQTVSYSQPRRAAPVVQSSEPEQDEQPADDARYGTHYIDAREKQAERAKADVQKEVESKKEVKQEAKAESKPEAESPATVLVFRDGHRQEVKNYAIQGATLFDFSTANRMKKIPLAELDMAATQRVNDEQGVDFRIPAVTDN